MTKDRKKSVLADILVLPEGVSFFQHNLSMVMDGYTGDEHFIPWLTVDYMTLRQ